jgi:hypothetical protein
VPYAQTLSFEFSKRTINRHSSAFDTFALAIGINLLVESDYRNCFVVFAAGFDFQTENV